MQIVLFTLLNRLGENKVIMSSQSFIINLREYLDENKPVYLVEKKLYKLLASFSCSLNPDVEHFLSSNAIEFIKKDQSVRYFVFSLEHLAGYFSLAIKPVFILASAISKAMARKLERISVFNEKLELIRLQLTL